jgi:hypothetical protein
MSFRIKFIENSYKLAYKPRISVLIERMFGFPFGPESDLSFRGGVKFDTFHGNSTSEGTLSSLSIRLWVNASGVCVPAIQQRTVFSDFIVKEAIRSINSVFGVFTEFLPGKSL